MALQPDKPLPPVGALTRRYATLGQRCALNGCDLSDGRRVYRDSKGNQVCVGCYHHERLRRATPMMNARGW